MVDIATDVHMSAKQNGVFFYYLEEVAEREEGSEGTRGTSLQKERLLLPVVCKEDLCGDGVNQRSEELCRTRERQPDVTTVS